MINEHTEPRSASGMVASLRARIARYCDHAAYFTRLAETERIETLRDQWKNLARDYAP
jgi:hypothetical protein